MADTTFIPRQTVITSEWAQDVNDLTYGIGSSDPLKGATLVGAIQAGSGAVKRSVQGELRDSVKLEQFGGSPDVVDNSIPLFNAITYCMANNKKLLLPAGDITIEGAEYLLTTPITIAGEGRGSTKLIFKGSPTKTVRTYATHRAEYDAGNYATSSDTAIACGTLDAMMALENSIDNYQLNIAMLFMQHAPQQRNLEFVIPCESRFAGVVVEYPLSMAKADSI